jgi:hypothetical protein
MLMIDPPQGWLFGFPKEISESVLIDGNIKEWLIENGYPKGIIDSFGENFICRFIYT